MKSGQKMGQNGPQGRKSGPAVLSAVLRGGIWERGPKYGAAVFQTATESVQNLDGGRGADIVALTISDYERKQSKQNRRSCTLKQNLG
jgi:hypothetical protein